MSSSASAILEAPASITTLSHEQIQALAAEYWEKGFIILRNLFTVSEIEAWRAECDCLLKADFVAPLNTRTPFRMNSGNTPERIDPVTDVSPTFKALRDDSRITDVIEAIFKDKALPFKDKVIFKLPGTDGYTMHQDQAYWQMCPADDILSVSVQIDGASSANGGIELFPGYHHELLTPEFKRMQMREEDIAKIDLSTIVKVESQPGDILIFHSLTPHQSGRNTATFPRRSLYLTYSAARSGDLYTKQFERYKVEQVGDKTDAAVTQYYFR